jgi:hypothetical protein
MTDVERAQRARVKATLRPYKRIALDSVFGGQGRFIVINKDNGKWYAMSRDEVARALAIKQSDPEKSMLRAIFRDVLQLDEAKYNKVKTSLVPREARDPADPADVWQMVQRGSDPKPVAKRKDLFGLYGKPSKPSYAVVVRFALDPKSSKSFRLIDITKLPPKQPSQPQLPVRPVQPLAHEDERPSFVEEVDEDEEASEARRSARQSLVRRAANPTPIVEVARVTRPIGFEEIEGDGILPDRTLKLITSVSEFGDAPTVAELLQRSQTPRVRTPVRTLVPPLSRFEDEPRSPPKWIGVVSDDQDAARQARVQEVVAQAPGLDGNPWRAVERVPYNGGVLGLAGTSLVEEQLVPSPRPSARLPANPVLERRVVVRSHVASSLDRRESSKKPAAPLALRAPPPPPPPPQPSERDDGRNPAAPPAPPPPAPPPPQPRVLPQRFRNRGASEPEINPSDLGEWPDRKESDPPVGRAFDVNMLRDRRNNLRRSMDQPAPKAAREVPSDFRASMQAEMLKNRRYLKAESPRQAESPVSGFTSP